MNAPTAEEHLGLVHLCANRFRGRGMEYEDLYSAGCIGLLKAVKAFDCTRGVQFSTYAVPVILGEIKRLFRDGGAVKVSRSLRDLAYKAMQAKERLTGTLQREPTIEQIATEIGAKREDVVIALESITDPVSLYEPVYSDSGDTLYVMDQISDRDSMENWLGELSIREAMQGLGQREKNILYLRFFRGKTQMEVAGEIGISQAQVSRLEKGALLKIKAAVQ